MAEYDWGTVSGEAHDVLKVKKIAAVPAAIIALAQKSFDGTELVKNGKVVTDENGQAVITHNLRHVFPNVEVARAFAKHMRNAGDHMTPTRSVTVVVDPDDDGKPRSEEAAAKGARTVAWKTGERRGRVPAA
jgi:hypothetical protein